MTARFRLPAGRSSDVGESEVARDRPSSQVVCNVLLLDNTVQEFSANVSKNTFTHLRFFVLVFLNIQSSLNALESPVLYFLLYSKAI